MKVQLAVALLLCGSVFSLFARSQAQNFPRDPRLPETPSDEMTPANAEPVAFSGKVSVEGGADILKDTVVVLDCGFGDRARTNVDPKGQFLLMLDNGGRLDQSGERRGGASSELIGCTLHAEAPGYQSSALDVQGHQSGVVEVGTILMSPMTQQQGDASTTVSVASLAAPDKAKKDFAKGQDQASKGRWAAACDSFRKAIQVYPRYALAWLELGRAQLHQNDFNQAQQSFQQATTEDSRFLPAYVELAHVQAAQQQWQAMARTTANIVQLAPESSAAFWFMDSAANFNVHNLQRADSSAQRGLRLDAGHHVPQLEYLYGLILATKQNYVSAVQHIKSYLQLSPRAQDAREAKRRLAELEKLASNQTAHAPELAGGSQP